MARAKLGLRGVPPCSPLGFLQNLDLSPVSALSLHGEKGGLESDRGHDHALHPSAGSHSKTRVPNGPCELGVSRRQGLTAAGAVVSPVFRHKPFSPPQYRRLLGATAFPGLPKRGREITGTAGSSVGGRRATLAREGGARGLWRGMTTSGTYYGRPPGPRPRTRAGNLGRGFGRQQPADSPPVGG